jgi:hypothetical protein
VLVDLAQGEPRYYVVPESKAVGGIRARHQEYLARNGGRRLVNDESMHCAIRIRDVAAWAERWDLLGLE